jgi:hypothetical protein
MIITKTNSSQKELGMLICLGFKLVKQDMTFEDDMHAVDKYITIC